MDKVSYQDLKKFDELLELIENDLATYLAERDIESSREIDQKILDIYKDVIKLRTHISTAIDEREEMGEVSRSLIERIEEKFDKLGLLVKGTGVAITIWELVEKIYNMIAK